MCFDSGVKTAALSSPLFLFQILPHSLFLPLSLSLSLSLSNTPSKAVMPYLKRHTFFNNKNLFGFFLLSCSKDIL